jgi:carbamoylphosphate synthase large subunit
VFRRYAAVNGLGHLLPATIDPAQPTFPAVLKRTNLNSAKGVVLVTSPRDLADRLGEAPWLGERVVLEEHVGALTDYVTHVVCSGGRAVWHCSYSYPVAAATTMRGTVEHSSLARHEVSTADIADFEKLFMPLAFDGPANIDYRRRPDGSLAIFEINPRLGGSLMRPENVHDLAAAFDAIVRHAKWRDGSPADAAAPV